MSASYEYGERGDRPPVKVTWYQGTVKPPHYTEKKIPQWDNRGVRVWGTPTLTGAAEPYISQEAVHRETK